jgi:hypothetical protein
MFFCSTTRVGMGRGEKISFFFKGVVDNMLFVLGLAREFIYIIFLFLVLLFFKSENGSPNFAVYLFGEKTRMWWLNLCNLEFDYLNNKLLQNGKTRQRIPVLVYCFFF